MRKIFIKNEGYKKMNYAEFKYNNIRLREKKIKKEKVIKKIITIIKAFSIIIIILFLLKLVIIKILNKNSQHNTNLPIETNIQKEKNKYLSLNYTTQNYTIKNITKEELKQYIEYMDKSKSGIFLNKKNLMKSKNPKISIIISVYNREDYINSTIRSVQNQNLPELEIVIIDDFSTDNTLKYVKILQKTDSRIVIYENKKNMGTLYSKSIGVLNSKGKYIYSLDSDDMMCNQNYLRVIYEEAIEGDYDFIQCTAIYIDEIRKVIFKRTPFWVVLWSKLIKKSIYQKAVYKLGKEVLSNKVVVLDDDVISTFLFIGKKSKKSNIIGVCHFTHLGDHVFFNQFLNMENTKKYCTNMIATIDAFYKMKHIFYGNFLMKYLFIGRGICKRYTNLTDAQKIYAEFEKNNNTKLI